MKTITSFGGPFIALERRFASEWSGVFGKRFVGEGARFKTDYEAACEATNGPAAAAYNCAIIDNGTRRGLVIAPPVETAIVPLDDETLFIIQIESQEDEFLIDNIDSVILQNAYFPDDGNLKFSTSGERLFLFDSANEIAASEENYLEFDLRQGNYAVSNCEHWIPDLVELNLFRIRLSA